MSEYSRCHGSYGSSAPLWQVAAPGVNVVDPLTTRRFPTFMNASRTYTNPVLGIYQPVSICLPLYHSRCVVGWFPVVTHGSCQVWKLTESELIEEKLILRMPRQWKRKTNRGVTASLLQKASDEVTKTGKSVRSAVKAHGICHVTLSRYCKSLQKLRDKGSSDLPSVGYRSSNRVFSEEQEKVLAEYLTKNQSLFDNNIKMKEMDNLELMLDSSAIPESGTASVKSRPTVKHYASSSDLVQGFAVPTPTVPVLPTANRPQINMNMNGDWMSNGSARSIPDLLDGGMFIPPPPSMAPPPPPTKFLPPTPDFLGDTVSFQLPPMAPPKPPSKQQSVARPEDPSLRPPSMPTPKPPSTTSSASSHLPNNTSPPTSVPDFTERPKFAPPQPPADMRQVALKALKNPPLKPVRLSSMASVDEPQGPAPTPPVKKPTPSSFNPQNTAKIYSVPKTGIPGKQTDQENRPKQILLLHDPKLTESGPVQVNRNPPAVAPPSKPARKNSFGLQLESKENLQAAWSGQATPAKTNEEVKVEPLPPSTEQVIPKPTNPPPEEPPKHQNVVTAPVTMDTSQIKHDVSSGQSHKFSPMLDRKLRSLKTSDVPATRKGPAASPLALLMAAKEREKHRFATSHEHKTTSNEPSTSIQHSESNPNSFTVNPRSTPFSSQEKPPSEVSVEPRLVIQAPSKPTESVVSQGAVPTSKFSSSSYPAMDTSGQQRIPPASSHAREQDKKEDQCMPLLAPPPEFDDNVTDSPPSSPPPDPPLKQVLPPTASPVVFVMPQTSHR
ncbi:hypothetical protein DPEC_G00212160 [Dallia pectoralis]|uniref:Uncharacterized protein n=1 Tax=Dallia pectoralis TaxID=75939 RepID=A0ACC2G6Q6_DALPE|nr:hypothetical protein DPEC_G00212160 [Dallia pectoralis]